MSVTKVLLDILIVLLTAKIAAELAERVHVPAVVGEIVAGVLIGPSVLGLVGGDDVLRVLGELGVILLLLEVGMEMDVAELGAVGRAAVSVALAGVIAPMAGGFGVGLAMGMSTNEALFVGAALTATSVGITARVFGDLRALASVEARTVLGAAVADDVMGLVILTVVVRVVTQGHVSLVGVAGVVGLALGFLVVTSWVGLRTAPAAFDLVARRSRSNGTLVAVALATTLGFAELANAAKLAPIVGAFVAGLALGRTSPADRIRRELSPVGHLFIPVFFLQIGIDADISQFTHPKVLGLAAALMAVAVIGKLLSVVGMFGSPGDRLLVGVGMIPRGEVGLIFASLGLRQHVFGEDVYGAVLLVVLATTLVTPPILRWRLLHLEQRAPAVTAAGPRPDGGWLKVDEKAGTVEVAATPPLGEALELAIRAALLGNRYRPGSGLLDWLSSLPDQPLRWNEAARGMLFTLLQSGGPRSWRFLEVTGVLHRSLPEISDALARRQADPFELDAERALRWARLSRLSQLEALTELEHPDWVRLAALILDATDGDADADGVVVARRIVQRLDLGAAAEQTVAGLVRDASMLGAAARRMGTVTEEQVLQMATHLGSTEQATALYLLTLAGQDLPALDRTRLEELHRLINAALEHPELTGREAGNAIERRRNEARRFSTDQRVQDRIEAAPRAYLLATLPRDIAEQAALCEPRLGAETVRCLVNRQSDSTWRVVFAARDRIGLLAAETEVLAAAGLNVRDTTAVTWADKSALAAFGVVGPNEPDQGSLETRLAARLSSPLSSPPATDISIAFDDDSSPWHTVCRVEGFDRPGLLHAIATALAVAGASVHSARIATVDGFATQEFELTDRNGRKVSSSIQDAISSAVTTGVTPRRRRFRPKQTRRVTRMQQNRDTDETSVSYRPPH